MSGSDLFAQRPMDAPPSPPTEAEVEGQTVSDAGPVYAYHFYKFTMGPTYVARMDAETRRRLLRAARATAASLRPDEIPTADRCSASEPLLALRVRFRRSSASPCAKGRGAALVDTRIFFLSPKDYVAWCTRNGEKGRAVP